MTSTDLRAPRHAPSRVNGAARGERPSVTGTATLVRSILRRDRVRIGLWVFGIALLVLGTAASIQGLYPNPADLRSAAELVEGNSAVIALNGPAYGIETIGGRTIFEVGTYAAVVVALMAIFMLGRTTRGEEESGRTELLRASVLGRHAPLAAATAVVAGMSIVTGLVVAVGLVMLGLAAPGAWTFGLGLAAIGLFFAGVTAVLAQITEHARAAYGFAGALLGVSYVLRAVGDAGDGRLSWASPIGWVQAMRPYAGDRLWPALLPLGGAALLFALAVQLESRRDLGAGMVAPRPGPASASPRLGGPLGLALRLQYGSLIGWSVGVFLLGAAYGTVAQDVEDFVGDNEALTEILTQGGGGDLVDLYLATTLLMVTLIAGGFALSSALRLRSEETAGRAEPVLAAPVPRARWAASHLAVAFIGSAVVVSAGGLGLGVAYALAAGDANQILRMLGAALAHLPALWVLVGLAAALFGWLPRALLVVWAVLAACLVIGMFGDLLELPGWVRDLSPFQHVTGAPVEGWPVGSVAVLVAVAAGLTAGGLVGFRGRDLG